jgi:hypothetical protein
MLLLEAMMFRKFAFFCLFSILAVPVHAQAWTQLAYYRAYIGPEDMQSSKGQPLRTLGAVLQQDRANFHRFGIRHQQDDGDPVFANGALRASIPDLVTAGRGDRGSLGRMARNGQPFLVNVFVCGFGRTPAVIYLAGAGEDHSGCY